VIYQPRPYQHLITAHELNTSAAACGLGMGMGKTAATLEAIAAPDGRTPARAGAGAAARRAIDLARRGEEVVEPLAPRSAADRRLDAASARKALRNSNAAVFTINYENVPGSSIISATNGRSSTSRRREHTPQVVPSRRQGRAQGAQHRQDRAHQDQGLDEPHRHAVA
jgi:hypothetical protein